MTLGLVGFLINAGLLLLTAIDRQRDRRSTSRSATSRRTC